MIENVQRVREWIDRQAKDHPLGDLRVFSTRSGFVHTWLVPQQPWTPEMQRVIDETYEELLNMGLDTPRETLARLFNLQYPGPEDRTT